MSQLDELDIDYPLSAKKVELESLLPEEDKTELEEETTPKKPKPKKVIEYGRPGWVDVKFWESLDDKKKKKVIDGVSLINLDK